MQLKNQGQPPAGLEAAECHHCLSDPIMETFVMCIIDSSESSPSKQLTMCRQLMRPRLGNTHLFLSQCLKITTDYMVVVGSCIVWMV